MNIGGCQKVSLVDYPDKIATVIFTNGCVFRCHFCYNAGLVKAPFKSRISEDDIFSFLKKRKGLVDGVVITGGEPTIHPDLADFMAKVKDLGFLIKLDTCGYLPKKLRRLIDTGHIDYLAMDIKAPLNRYHELVGIDADTKKIEQSVSLIINSGIPYEFRSTLIDTFHRRQDIMAMAKLISGASRYFLQPFQPIGDLIDEQYRQRRAPQETMLQKIAADCQQYVDLCQVRS